MRLVKLLSRGEGIRTLLWTFIKSFQVRLYFRQSQIHRWVLDDCNLNRGLKNMTWWLVVVNCSLFYIVACNLKMWPFDLNAFRKVKRQPEERGGGTHGEAKVIPRYRHSLTNTKSFVLMKPFVGDGLNVLRMWLWTATLISIGLCGEISILKFDVDQKLSGLAIIHRLIKVKIFLFKIQILSENWNERRTI